VKNKDGSQDKNQLDDDVYRGQDFRTRFEKSGKGRSGSSARTIYEAADGDFIDVRKRNVDRRHHHQGDRQRKADENFCSA
jgi:hypothetical protein